MGCDRHRLQQRLRRLQRQVAKQGGDGGRQGEALAAAIAASAQRRQQRHAALPAVHYPAQLPVSERHQDIAAAIQAHQVIIVAGETGSGKTTQLPKICLELGRGVDGFIGHTQPRRIAARTVASRIAEELDSSVGEVVGYKVRFSDQTHADSYIKLMTDGILLAELQSDRFLNQYDTLIIDEAHERSLNIDFLLGYLKQLLPKRPDLKLIITSATIDTERFSRHFNDAPVIEVSGRVYPVEILYRHYAAEDEELDYDPNDEIVAAVDEVTTLDPRGDVLIFLSGEREIREAMDALRKHHMATTELLPLYSRLSAKEQGRVFQPLAKRKIILATNVAETSLTVPGIRFVIDTGLARISRYSYRSKVQRLPIEKISQSSANQRAGRCGRVSDGVCIRLYSEDDFLARSEFTQPEIQRTNLASVILQMTQLGLGDPADFPFIDKPHERFINDGYSVLNELGAINPHRGLTALGRQLARLPLDPKIGRMIMAANDNNCLHEILIIASALSIQDPRERPHDKQQQADEKHTAFRDEESDFVALLNLWRHYQEQRKHLTQNKLRQYCRQQFLSYMRMREWWETYSQLNSMIKGMGMKPNTTAAGYEAIHQSLLTGLLANIGTKIEVEEKRQGEQKGRRKSLHYQGVRNSQFQLYPGSGLKKKAPKWVMSAELVETTRLYARQNARIEPQWVIAAAEHLVKRSYSEPHWSPRQGKVFAYETVTLYGLVLSSGRRVNYAPIDGELSRQLFIREALVAGHYHTRAEFFRHNRRLIDEALSIESKTRRTDVLVDEESLYRFFDAILPAHIVGHASLEKWRKQAEAVNPDVLKLSAQDVFAYTGNGLNDDYPSSLNVRGMTLPLRYCFNPGGDDDGVTAIIPLGALNQVTADDFDWLVPGFLADKITALLKALPKAVRKQLVPIPEYSRHLLSQLRQQDTGLIAAIEEVLAKEKNIHLTPGDWQSEVLPTHLHMRFQIVDHNEKVLACGRDLAQLQTQFQQQSADEMQHVQGDQQWPSEGITQWDFGDLPESIPVVRGDRQYRAYPALVDKQQSVGIELFASAAEAQQAHEQGLLRLTALQRSKDVAYLRRQFPLLDTMTLHYARLQQATKESLDDFKSDLLQLVLTQCFFSKGFSIHSQQAYMHCLTQARPLMQVATAVGELVADILKHYSPINTRLETLQRAIPPEITQDILTQLNNLLFPGFVRKTPYIWLLELPRFLRAIEARLEKLATNPAADLSKFQRLQPLLQEYALFSSQQDLDAVQKLRWMLEEFRVSLFAQTLKTSIPVSEKRIRNQIMLCRQAVA
jgi:ATP-dependent helicase HrpA